MRLIDADALMKIYADRMSAVAERYSIGSSECGILAGAMKLLETQPTTAQPEQLGTNLAEGGTDAISRQAAIDALKQCYCGGEDVCGEPWIYEEHAIKAINTLPSAQPEIIRCKDCKHWDGVDTCDVIDAPVWDNDFCSMAERRSDE